MSAVRVPTHTHTRAPRTRGTTIETLQPRSTSASPMPTSGIIWPRSGIDTSSTEHAACCVATTVSVSVSVVRDDGLAPSAAYAPSSSTSVSAHSNRGALISERLTESGRRWRQRPNRRSDTQRRGASKGSDATSRSRARARDDDTAISESFTIMRMLLLCEILVRMNVLRIIYIIWS